MNLKLTEFGENVTGEVTVRTLTNGQRMKMFSAAGVDYFQMQKDLKEDEAAAQRLVNDLIVSVMDDLGEYVEKVALEMDGQKITSFDQIASDPKLTGIQITITSNLLFATQQILNKKKKRSAKR